MKLWHNQVIMHAKQNVTALAGLTTLSNMISHSTGIGPLTGETPTTIAGRIVATGRMMVKFLDSCPIKLTIFVGILPGVLNSLLRSRGIFLERGLSGLAKNYLPQRFRGNQSYSLLFGRLGIVRSDVRTIHTPKEVDGKAALLPMSFSLRSIGPR